MTIVDVLNRVNKMTPEDNRIFMSSVRRCQGHGMTWAHAVMATWLDWQFVTKETPVLEFHSLTRG